MNPSKKSYAFAVILSGFTLYSLNVYAVKPTKENTDADVPVFQWVKGKTSADKPKPNSEPQSPPQSASRSKSHLETYDVPFYELRMDGNEILRTPFKATVGFVPGRSKTRSSGSDLDSLADEEFNPPSRRTSRESLRSVSPNGTVSRSVSPNSLSEVTSQSDSRSSSPFREIKEDSRSNSPVNLAEVERCLPGTLMKEVNSSLEPAGKCDPQSVIVPAHQTLNTMFEIYGLTYPNGPDGGELYLVRPREDKLEETIAKEGSLFKKQKTEYNQKTAALYNALHFGVTTHPKLGEYWSAVPSPKLIESSSKIWNEKVGPKNRIHLGYRTTGPDNQVQMLKLWNDHYTIGVADPFKTFEDFYIPVGAPPPTQVDMDKVEVREDGRVNERNSLFWHDVGQVANSFHMTQEPLEVTGKLGRFYDEAYQYLKGNEELSKKFMKGPEAEKIAAVTKKYKPVHSATKDKGAERDVSSNAAEGGKAAGAPESGITPMRYFRVQLHHGQRAIHSITHILSWLINHPEGMDPTTFKVTDRGSTFEREIIVHMAGLGHRSPDKPIPAWAPMLELNFGEAETTGKITLESALEYITNRDMKRAKETVDTIGDPGLTAIYQRHLEAGTFKEASPETIRRWAGDIRNFYDSPSGVSRKN